MNLLGKITVDRRVGPLSFDLIDWEVEHADPYGAVWLAAVVGDDWAVYPPGWVNLCGNDPLHRVAPLWVRYNAACGRRRPRLRRVRRWLLPWVEGLAGGGHRVTDHAEGWVHYGPEYDQVRYVVYLRLGSSSGAGAETVG